MPVDFVVVEQYGDAVVAVAVAVAVVVVVVAAAVGYKRAAV